MNEMIDYDEERFLTVTSSYNRTNETSPQLLRDLPDYMEVNGEEVRTTLQSLQQAAT